MSTCQRGCRFSQTPDLLTPKTYCFYSMPNICLNGAQYFCFPCCGQINWDGASYVHVGSAGVSCQLFCVLTRQLHSVQKISRQRKAAIVVQTARDSLSLAAYGGTFLLTDNLLTPCVASVSCNMLFSLYQRAKYQKLQSRTQQHIVSMLEDFQAVKKASQQVSIWICTPFAYMTWSCR